MTLESKPAAAPAMRGRVEKVDLGIDAPRPSPLREQEGRATNACARTTAVGVKAIRIPSLEQSLRDRALTAEKPSAKEMPATEGGP